MCVKVNNRKQHKGTPVGKWVGSIFRNWILYIHWGKWMSRAPHINMDEFQRHSMEREKNKLPNDTYIVIPFK